MLLTKTRKDHIEKIREYYDPTTSSEIIDFYLICCTEILSRKSEGEVGKEALRLRYRRPIETAIHALARFGIINDNLDSIEVLDFENLGPRASKAKRKNATKHQDNWRERKRNKKAGKESARERESQKEVTAIVHDTEIKQSIVEDFGGLPGEITNNLLDDFNAKNIASLLVSAATEYRSKTPGWKVEPKWFSGKNAIELLCQLVIDIKNKYPENHKDIIQNWIADLKSGKEIWHDYYKSMLTIENIESYLNSGKNEPALDVKVKLDDLSKKVKSSSVGDIYIAKKLIFGINETLDDKDITVAKVALAASELGPDYTDSIFSYSHWLVHKTLPSFDNKKYYQDAMSFSKKIYDTKGKEIWSAWVANWYYDVVFCKSQSTNVYFNRVSSQTNFDKFRDAKNGDNSRIKYFNKFERKA